MIRVTLSSRDPFVEFHGASVIDRDSCRRRGLVAVSGTAVYRPPDVLSCGAEASFALREAPAGWAPLDGDDRQTATHLPGPSQPARMERREPPQTDEGWYVLSVF